MKLSIIIISYNTCDILCECLNSIMNSKVTFEYEIIVVDNKSSDNSVKEIRKNYPEVKLICNSENLLYSKANNIGAQNAKGEYLLLLNSDTLLFNNSLQKIVNFMDKCTHDIACVGPIILNKDKTIQSIGYAFPGLTERFVMSFNLNKIGILRYCRKILPKGIPIKNDIRTRECGWVSGSCMLIRSDVYKVVGGLNERLEFYGEEPELGWRLRNNGYKTYFTSESRIIHIGGASTKTRIEKTVRLRRYSVLQEETVGIAKSIWMSRIVLFANRIKYLLSSNKDYFDNAIKYELEVIRFLKECKKQKK